MLSYYGYGPYEGVCYDGPHEGRSYKQEYASFRVALYVPLRGVYSFDALYELEHPSVRIGHYRWSHPLRKWVFQP